MSIISPQLQVRAAVSNAFKSGQYVEMSPEAGTDIENQVNQADGFDVSPKQASGGDIPMTQRTAYILKGELYTNTQVSGGMAHFITNQWEDLGQAPIFNE